MNDYCAFLENYETIKKANLFSVDILQRIESRLAEVLKDLESTKYTIVTTGSFGREEASEESDLDLFIFCEDLATKEKIIEKKAEIEKVVNEFISKQVGDTGTFGVDAISIFEDILKNIGGSNDSNESLTRRMLFLLEGKSIYNKDVFDTYRNILIRRYVEATSDGIAIDKFILNDIIRYYRTITTDFQYKVEQDGKSWGLRNIKLRFSRKLLYYAGVLTIAAVNDFSSRSSRIDEIAKLLDIPVLKRIHHITSIYNKKEGEEKISVDEIFKYYDYFLKIISDEEKRKSLENIKKKEERLDSPIYMELSRDSNEFTVELHSLLNKLYDTKHPIHMSLVF
ncbi:Nucleotidyltransferase domain [Serratia fonticola]|uniref:nucleotidyltransferase domain-containing protein n=1 Tax=Serratia fonticola TaxID=47917 RepID=UPI002182F086|nr:nucleotidyltransferase domain-containing protein [Serratia fonticola]CAI2431109.1 Nucleotidyltransferase domain [Serratia fonticola]